jgi:hypothetical protein
VTRRCRHNGRAAGQASHRTGISWQSRAPDMIHLIVTGCGRRVARDTWMIVEGQVNEPALQGEYLLLTRRGHVLLWNSQ